MEIYIVTEVHEDMWHHSTVHSTLDAAIERVKFLLEGYDSHEHPSSWLWKAYIRKETALRASIKMHYITIDKFIYSPGHDEWVPKY